MKFLLLPWLLAALFVIGLIWFIRERFFQVEKPAEEM